MITTAVRYKDMARLPGRLIDQELLRERCWWWPWLENQILFIQPEFFEEACIQLQFLQGKIQADINDSSLSRSKMESKINKLP